LGQDWLFAKREVKYSSRRSGGEDVAEEKTERMRHGIKS